MAKSNSLNIRELLGSNYYIPDYQRNYAWEMKHVEQLIQDVIDYAVESGRGTPYYVGNIIVERNNVKNTVKFETIDGQQRLTTIYIILCALKNNTSFPASLFSFFNQDCLSFTYRDDSDNSLKYIYSRNNERADTTPKLENCEQHIIEIYNALCKKNIIESKCKIRNLDIQDFVTYLLDDVKFLRIPLPDGIDKNHYFEVMNSRGIQLEQHEIIKSDLMSCLESDGVLSQEIFDQIWTACSFMERYVQMNITNTKFRSVLFGNSWDQSPFFTFSNQAPDKIFDSIVTKSSDILIKSTDSEPFTIIKFLNDFKDGKYSEYIESNCDDDGTYVPEERFYSVIDFPNFLLHVLKLLYPNSKKYSKVLLDDKSLEKSFSSVLSGMSVEEKKVFSKEFVVTLLQCRYLFDKYSLRRDRAAKPTVLTKDMPIELSQEDDERKWCIKSLKQTPSDSSKVEYVSTFGGEDANEILMLLCVFHVSLSSRTRKNWLQAVLAYTYKNPKTSAHDYKVFLKRLAATYMRDNYLTSNNCDLLCLIYNEQGELTCTPHNTELEFDSTIDNGVGVERFILNYYEYLLWLNEGRCDYEFTYRTTVEHFFPQNAKEEDIADMPIEQKDKFGNLCLLSSKINPKFSNEYPFSKITDYSSYFVMNLKLQRMKRITEGHKNDNSLITQKWWFIKDINDEETFARDLFSKALLEDKELNQ